MDDEQKTILQGMDNPWEDRMAAIEARLAGVEERLDLILAALKGLSGKGQG